MDPERFKKATGGGYSFKEKPSEIPKGIGGQTETVKDDGNETVEIEHPVLTEDREAMSLIAKVAEKGFIFRHEKFTEGAKHDLEKTQEIILDLEILIEMILGVDRIVDKIRSKGSKESRLMVAKNGYELTPSPRDANANDEEIALQMFRDIKIAEEFSGYIDLNLVPEGKKSYLKAIRLRNKK